MTDTGKDNPYKASWEDFCYSFVDPGLFDYDRAKTVSAMKTLWERAPQDDMDKVAGVLVFAPSVGTLGEAHTFAPIPGAQIRWIYLSPMLESKTLAEVDAIVAHEFAYVVLGHGLPGSTDGVVPPGVTRHADLPHERDADALISRWGFDPNPPAAPDEET
jgi:hypothetical protein